jgi:hypothetical protein
MSNTLFSVPIKTGLIIQFDKLLGFIARELIENTAELWLHENFDTRHHNYYRFRLTSSFGPTAIYIDKHKVVLRGQWKERATSNGETWEQVCVLIHTNAGVKDSLRIVEVFADDQWEQLIC